MNIAELRAHNRKEEFVAICHFIEECDYEELALIVEEIRCCHDNLMVWDEDHALLSKIESVSLNGECIQLNIERTEENEI